MIAVVVPRRVAGGDSLAHLAAQPDGAFKTDLRVLPDLRRLGQNATGVLDVASHALLYQKPEGLPDAWAAIYRNVGIVQSDIIVREAVRAAIKEMRDNPSLIDDMLEDLPGDDLTAGRYGELTIQQCKNWFTKTKINVKLGLQVSQADLPAVAIALGAGPEAQATLGDVDWDQRIDVDPADPDSRRERRGVTATENYTLACFANGEPEYALFLYSVVLFALLRGKDRWLDQRGFLCSTFAVGALARPFDKDVENVYVRNITLTGSVRHTWPAGSGKVITEVETNLPTDAVVEPPGKPVKTILSKVQTDLTLLLDQDMLSGVR